MSRRSSHHYQNEYSGHDINARPYSAPAGARTADYTLVHGGRQLRLGPVAFWVVIGVVAVMGLWTVTTATYFAFREDVLTRLIARQAEMQFGYEDRIAELRTQVDRISSRQLLDQEQYEQKLDQVLRRQSTLEQRSSALSSLPDGLTTGSIRLPAGKTPTERTRTVPSKPSPISDKGAFLLPPDARGELPVRLTGKSGLDGALARLNASLDRLEHRQGSTLDSLEASMDFKARRMRGVLADLGLDKGKIATAGTAGIGGPFIPVRVPNDANTFDKQVHRIKLARTQVDHLTRTLSTLPVRKPLAGELDVSSGFGVRSDPFTRSAAMHTGLDLHGEMGEPVRVTANGTVSAAGWSGGYGKVVDVDHGNGFVTRYGHLSEIDVKVGQTLRVGQVVGRVGSTGRSTGTHLHYETRVGGQAVDPEKFLRAGAKLDGGI
jgi:murein DD-endopeptidase MepM/ murein hydrolase activator NlpD